jgi:hypothetical protein
LLLDVRQKRERIRYKEIWKYLQRLYEESSYVEYYKGIKKMMGEQLHITADKREIRDFPKLPLATSFIRKTLYAIVGARIIYLNQRWRLQSLPEQNGG